jgi:hypothetical protein
MTQDKSLQFEYMLSSDWHQYKLLWKWANMIASPQGSGCTAENKESIYLPITLIFISEFKKPVFAMEFFNCFIKNFASINFDQQSDDEVIKHAFTVGYSHFEFLPNITTA